jgi:hypothetical protein
VPESRLLGIFYDSSKNQARVWHNTAVCGNLINLRASRARRREQASLARWVPNNLNFERR